MKLLPRQTETSAMSALVDSDDEPPPALSVVTTDNNPPFLLKKWKLCRPSCESINLEAAVGIYYVAGSNWQLDDIRHPQFHYHPGSSGMNRHYLEYSHVV